MSFRECPQCGDEVVGRADKVFCSPSCKSLHFREHGGPAPAVPLAGPVRWQPVPMPVPPAEEDDDGEGELDIAAVVQQALNRDKEEQQRGDRARRQQEAEEEGQARAVALHGLYCQDVDDFLQEEGPALKKADLQVFLADLDDDVAQYRGHPHLGALGYPAAGRLALLHWMRDSLRRCLEEVTDNAAGVWLGNPAPVYLELRKKDRARLRDSLLGAP
jgi:hypothetical protein